MAALIGAASLSLAQDRDRDSQPRTPGAGVGPFSGRVIRVEADKGILTLAIDRDRDRRLSTDTPDRPAPRDKAAAGGVMSFRFTSDLRVSLDGRAATASDLRQGLYARVYPRTATAARNDDRTRSIARPVALRDPVPILPIDTRVVRTGRDRPSDSVATRPTDPPRPRAEQPSHGPGRDRPSDSVETRPTDPPRPRIENPRPRDTGMSAVRTTTGAASSPAMVAERIEAFTKAPAETSRPAEPDRSLRTRPSGNIRPSDKDR